MADIEMNRINEIASLHSQIGGLLKLSLDKAIRIGELLTEQKASLKHGEYMPWVKANLPFTERTAQNYMRLYNQREQLKNENVSHLNEGYRLLQGLGAAAKPKGLLQQLQDLAERKLRLERDAGGAMNEINRLLTPMPGHTIVGVGDEHIVFHIECVPKGKAHELVVYKLSGEFGGGFTEQRQAVTDEDFWWYLDRHIGIGRVRAIWDDREIVLPGEDTQRIEDAIRPKGFWEACNDESFWHDLGPISPVRANFDESSFVESAQRLYEGLMSAYGRLCDAYWQLMGTVQTANG